MIRTVFGVGVMAIIGIVALKLIFGVFGALVGLFCLAVPGDQDRDHSARSCTS